VVELIDPDQTSKFPVSVSTRGFLAAAFSSYQGTISWSVLSRQIFWPPFYCGTRWIIFREMFLAIGAILARSLVMFSMIILISRRECRYPSLAGVCINLRQLRSTTIGKGTWNRVSVNVAHTMTSLVAMMDMVLLTGVWTLK
jgi:hypothetical protein